MMDVSLLLEHGRALLQRARMAGEDPERGATMVEYALLVAMIAVVCIIALRFLGSSASAQFSSVGASLGQ